MEVCEASGEGVPPSVAIGLGVAVSVWVGSGMAVCVAASGATVEGKLEDVQARVLAATREWLRGLDAAPAGGG